MDRKTIDNILDHGGSIQLPYKQELRDFFHPGGVSFSKLDDNYCIFGGNIRGVVEFETFEEAWEKFEEYLENAGAMQEYIRHKIYPDLDIEDDWKKVAKMIRDEKKRRKMLNLVKDKT